MKKISNRFLKLECTPILRIFKKQDNQIERFEYLEIEGHHIQVAIDRQPTRGYLDCPMCGKRISESGAKYCYYCGYDPASRIAGGSLDTASLKIHCNDCQAVTVGNQDFCVSCGSKHISKGDDTEVSVTTRNEFKTGKPIMVNIDGHMYSSADKNLPDNVKELMDTIDKEGYSKDVVDAWVRKSKSEIESNLAMIRDLQRQDLEDRAKGFLVGAVLVAFAILYIISLSFMKR